jgi:predicted DNA-binding transcriptional regulator AlpA
MRIAEFKRRLSCTPVIAIRPPRDAEAEVFIPYKKLAEHGLHYSRVHLRRLQASGLFPLPSLLSPNRQAYRLSEIAAWKANRPVAPSPAEAAL